MALSVCGSGGGSGSGASTRAVPAPAPTPVPAQFAATTVRGIQVAIAPVAVMDRPWAVNFLPDGRMLVTDAFSELRLVTQLGQVSAPIQGLPDTFNVPFDIVASPTFATDRMIYLSFAELGANGTRISRTVNPTGDQSLAVLTATLDTPSGGELVLRDVKIIWRQQPNLTGLIFYKGSRFTSWLGDALLGGLQSRGLVFVRTSGRTASEIDRLPLGARIRDVREAPDGAVWVLEDAPTGRLLRLTPG